MCKFCPKFWKDFASFRQDRFNEANFAVSARNAGKNKSCPNLRTLNLTPILLKAQTRSRQIYRAEPTKTNQGSVKFISLKFELNLRANFTKRQGNCAIKICKAGMHALHQRRINAVRSHLRLF